MIDLTITDWRLIDLHVEGLGPFVSSREFDFMGDTAALEGRDDAPGPSNLYMLCARNGCGKTTVLETIYGLFGLMASTPRGRFADYRAPGIAQLDLRATWTIEGRTRTVLLSIWTGQPQPVRTWSDDDLEERASATEWAKLGLLRSPGGVTCYDATNELGFMLLQAIRESAGRVSGSLFGESLYLPTVLFFPADRMLLAPEGQRLIEAPDNWIYEPAQCFGVDGASWNGSIENLFAWLTWVDGDQLKQLLKFVNEHVFDESGKELLPIERSELATYVMTPDGRHAMSGLSHGERALVQLFLRTAAHMTRNTIVLIDEIEIHLHTKWLNRMFQLVKQLLQSIPTLSIVFTTHSRELAKVFDFRRMESGIVKGGFVINEDLD